MKILTTTISPWESIPIQVLRRRVTDQLRRDRINNSLETLRLLLLGKTKTHNAWTPRMQKAQILESVVDFLRSDQVMDIISHQQRTGVLSSEEQQRTGVLFSEGQQRTGVLSSEGQQRMGVLFSEGQQRTGVLFSEGQQRMGVLFSEGQPRTGVLSSEGQQRTGVLSSEGQQRMGVLSSKGQQGPSRDMMAPDFCGGGMIPQGYCEGMTPQGYVEAMKTESLDNMVPCLPNVRLGRQPGGSWFQVGAGGRQQQQGYVEAMKSESLDNMVPCLPNVRLGRQPGGSWFLVGAGGGGGQQQQGCRQHPAPHGHGIQLHGAVTSPSIGGLSGLTAARLVFNQPRF